MIAPVSAERATRALEFGIYRDGDNNLDEVQARVLDQARTTSATDRSIEFTVEDTTARRGFAAGHLLRTESYTIADGNVSSAIHIGPPHDMSDRDNLAHFVARVLDQAQQSGAKETWLDLVDHGGGDGGGLQANHGIGIMSEDDMAGAIADGVALHAHDHPDDAARRIDGVVANQCLMATLGFESALSHAGVRFLAASPETMLAPGVPTTVAHAIAQNIGDPDAMANAVVAKTMRVRYDAGNGERFGPAAAFDVLDLAPAKIAAMQTSVARLDAALSEAATSPAARQTIREDAKAIDGMVRFPDGDGMPWRADRPALALYQTFAEDGRLPENVRAAAAAAQADVAATVLAHRESGAFAPFAGADYGDAAGPTVHFPTTRGEVDPWRDRGISETNTAFYDDVGAADLAGRIA